MLWRRSCSSRTKIPGSGGSAPVGQYAPALSRFKWTTRCSTTKKTSSEGSVGRAGTGDRVATPPQFSSQVASNSIWTSPQGQISKNYLASNEKQCFKKNIVKGGISQVSPEASSCLFSPEELKRVGSQETCQLWPGQPIHLSARRPETVAMTAKKRTGCPENGVIATQRDRILGGWPLHQGDLSHCSQQGIF